MGSVALTSAGHVPHAKGSDAADRELNGETATV